MENLKLSNSFVVTMHHDLVQARLSDSLTTNEQKILYAVLSNIEPPEFVLNSEGKKVIKEPIKEIKPFRVPIKDFTEWLGFKDPNYVAFKNTIKKLMRKLIEIKQDDGSWELFQWVTSAKYIKSEGVAEIKLSPELYPYLLNLEKNFTTVKLKVLLSFKSVYSPKLYSLAKKWLKIGTWKVEVEELKHLIGVPLKEVNGVKEFRLSRYNHFKTRALEIAVNEINEHSELKLSFVENKKGRKITSITFHIEEKKERTLQKKRDKENKGNEKIYGEEFLKKYRYDSNKEMYIDQQTNEEILFDGRDRIKAILLLEELHGLDNNSLFVIENILNEIIDIHEFDLINNIHFLFSYTKRAKTINNPSAFIISTLNKIKSEVLSGNYNVEVSDVITVNNFTMEKSPKWFYKALRSKREVNKEEKIEQELNKIDGTNLTLDTIRYFKLMEDMRKYKDDDYNLETELDSKYLSDYKEYKGLRDSGDLEALISRKKDSLKALGVWSESRNDIIEGAVEVMKNKELVIS